MFAIFSNNRQPAWVSRRSMFSLALSSGVDIFVWISLFCRSQMAPVVGWQSWMGLSKAARASALWFGAPFQTIKLAAYYAIWQGIYK